MKRKRKKSVREQELDSFSELMETFIYDVCSVLDIETPNAFGMMSEGFKTKTTMAIYVRSERELYINSNYCVNGYQELIMFCIAHEMRHAWQNEHFGDSFFSNYKTSDKVNLATYNSQKQEIDANAFGFAYMDILFDLFGIPEWDRYGMKEKLLNDYETLKRYETLKKKYTNAVINNFIQF